MSSAPKWPARRKHSRTGAITLVCLIAAGLLAACSSDSKPTAEALGNPSASGGAGNCNGSPTATKSTIVVGTIGSYSGQAEATTGPALAAIKAWACNVNAHGGLNGHPVKLIVKDDKTTGSTAIAAAKELVDQEGIVAVLNDWSGFDTQWATFLQSKNVPVLGGHNLGEFSTSPLFFPSGTTLANLLAVAFKAAHGLGADQIGVPYCSATPACKQGVDFAASAAAKSDSKVVWSGAFSESSTDFTSQCLAARDAKANGMLIQDVTDVVVRFAASCEQQGFLPRQITYAGTPGDAMLKDKAWEGLIGAESNAPWYDTSTPATKEFATAMATYASGSKVNAASMQAWAAGKLFEAAYTADGSPDKPSSADILNGLYSFKGETLQGLAPPLTYSKGQVADIKCGFLIGIKSGQWSEPDGMNTNCAP
ncbi:ABC transporter substrate-binding protein [Jatrophihabitans sp. DSM 45814]